MRKIVVRCAYCQRRYDVSGCQPGTRLRCGGCQRIMVVPRVRTAVRPSMPSWIKPTAISVAAGFVVALGVFVLLNRAQNHSSSPATPTAVASTPVQKTSADGPSIPVVADVRKVNVWDYEKERTKKKILLQFESLFTFHTARPFLIALERSGGYDESVMIREYLRRAQSVYEHILGQFKDDLRLQPITDKVLTLIILKNKESFNRYFEKQHNFQPPEYFHGDYHPDHRWAVVYHPDPGSDGTIKFSATHEMVHHIFDVYMDAAQKKDRPAWIDEAVASYFEYFEERRDTGALEFEQISKSRMKSLNTAGIIPLGEFVNMSARMYTQKFRKVGTADPLEQQNREQLFYAQGYALVYFFRHDQHFYSRFTKYLKQYLTGGINRETFVLCFGRLDLVEQEFLEFLPEALKKMRMKQE